MWHEWGGGWKGAGFWWGEHEEKRPLGRPGSRWEENVKMGVQKVGLGGMVWIVLAQDRDSWRAVVNAAMNLRDA